MWYFGTLIGNIDMRDGNGNLSFQPSMRNGLPRLRLSPAYAMLRMLHAPARDVELPVRKFEPELPL